MKPPSEEWQGFAALEPDSNKYTQIQRLIGSANFEYLQNHAVQCRRALESSLDSGVYCTANVTRFKSGFDNVAMELAFSDNQYWIARIPYKLLDEDARVLTLSEIATMRIIRENTTIPVPQVFGFEISADQPFGYPYTFLEYLGGRSLPTGVARCVPVQHLRKIAKQLANVFFELQNLTFSRIGRLWCGENADGPIEIIPMAWHSTPGPLDTSLEYFYNQRQGENREIMAMHEDNDPDWLTACWVMKSALSSIIIEDRVRGPFPLCHLDLHFGNMLFDDDYNLIGIIDWSSAQAAPLEQLSVSPEFITFPGLSAERNQPILDLKQSFIEALREMEISRERKPPFDNTTLDKESVAALTPLSTFAASKSAEIVHRLYMASPRGSLWAGRMVAKLMYGQNITWEQLRQVYGTTLLVSGGN